MIFRLVMSCPMAVPAKLVKEFCAEGLVSRAAVHCHDTLENPGFFRLLRLLLMVSAAAPAAWSASSMALTATGQKPFSTRTATFLVLAVLMVFSWLSAGEEAVTAVSAGAG